MHRQVKGQFSKQSHVAIPEGLHEEEFGRNGFFGPVSQLYHTHPPTGWTRIEGPLRPQAFDTARLQMTGEPLPNRTAVLSNPDVTVHISRPKSAEDWFFRNADGDEVVFVHQGHGVLESDFGLLPYEPGDYLIIPRGTTHRMVPDTPDNGLVIFESHSVIRQPDRGLLGQYALYDADVLVTPDPHVFPGQANHEYEIRIKRQNQVSSVFYPFHPLDVAGWKGDLYVWKLNVRDIRPVMSHRMHLPPSVHTTLLGDGFVICTFVPRPLETDPEAVRVPFYHRNIDYDEVIFYHSGDFFSRDGIGPGMITFHPQGIHHGPHPNAVKNSTQKTETHEVAVMIDCIRPLEVTPAARSTEWADYWQSWRDPSEPAG